MISLTGPAWASEGLGAIPTLLWTFLRYLLTDWVMEFPLYDLGSTLRPILPVMDIVANLGIGISGLLGGVSASPSNLLIGSVQSIFP